MLTEIPLATLSGWVAAGSSSSALIKVNKGRERTAEHSMARSKLRLARSSSSCRDPFPPGCANVVDAAPNYLCKPFDDSAICAFSKFGRRRCSQLLRFALIRMQTTSYTPCLFPSRFAPRFSLGGCLFSGDFSSLATVYAESINHHEWNTSPNKLRLQRGWTFGCVTPFYAVLKSWVLFWPQLNGVVRAKLFATMIECQNFTIYPLKAFFYKHYKILYKIFNLLVQLRSSLKLCHEVVCNLHHTNEPLVAYHHTLRHQLIQI